MVRIILILAASAVAQQVYENPTLNVRYEAPAGWVFDKPDTAVFGTVRITPNRVGLNPVYIALTFDKTLTAEGGFKYPQVECFLAMKSFYNFFDNTTKSPILTVITDTVVGGVHFSSIIMKQLDLNRIIVVRSASNRTYAQSYQLVTTISDFEANSTIYNSNWMNTEFISLTGTTAKFAGQNPNSQAKDRQKLIDLLGRKAGQSMPRMVIPDRR